MSNTLRTQTSGATVSSTDESYWQGQLLHRVGASRLLGSPGEGLVCVFQCYLDDSGTNGLPIVTLGGFVASTDQWERVEPLVDAVMNHHGVEVFHAKQFHDTDPPFKGWSRVRKISFAEEVFAAAHGAMAGVAIGVDKEGLKRGKKAQPGKLDRMSPIGVAFGTIMTKLLTHRALGAWIKENGVSFLLETGNKNNAEIEEYFHRMAKSAAFEGTLRSITQVPKAHCRAIQLADFMVFYVRRVLRNEFRFMGKNIALPACPYVETMRKHGPIFRQIAHGSPKVTGAMMDKDINSLDDLVALTKRDFS